MTSSRSALFIDFHGTICFDLFWKSVSEQTNAYIQQYLFTDHKILHKWMTGEHTSEQINQHIAHELGINYFDLWASFIHDCKSMHIDQKVLDTLSLLKQQNRHKLILITDNMDCFDRFTRPSLGLDQYFDAIENSYNHKILKADNQGYLFKYLCERHNIDINHSVLLDDSAQNFEIFKILGGHSIMIKNIKDTQKSLSNFVI